MFSASQLSEEQKQALHRWAEEGASIADLQKRLQEEYEVKITYMDARFLVLDLGISIRAEESEGGDEPSGEPTGEPAPESSLLQEDEPAAPAGGGGKVSVTMDSVAVPGALVSGKVSFSDGESAVWMLDQMGRPGLDPDTPGYRPSQEDVMAFQKQLSELVRQQGY